MSLTCTFTIDLAPFLRYLVKKGKILESYWLQGLEMGNQIDGASRGERVGKGITLVKEFNVLPTLKEIKLFKF